MVIFFLPTTLVNSFDLTIDGRNSLHGISCCFALLYSKNSCIAKHFVTYIISEMDPLFALPIQNADRFGDSLRKNNDVLTHR